MGKRVWAGSGGVPVCVFGSAVLLPKGEVAGVAEPEVRQLVCVPEPASALAVGPDPLQVLGESGKFVLAADAEWWGHCGRPWVV